MAFWRHTPAPGSREALEQQKRAIAGRGASVVFFAHVAALVILIVFSLGSLVGLTGEALTQAILEWQRGVYDIPRAIEVIVSTLLVPAMDVAMFYAAIAVRVRRQRRQGGLALHVFVIGAVSLIEASTYIYMSAVYDNPGQDWALWALIVVRGVAAPLLATYLSLAMTPALSSGDILYLTESVAADGVYNDTAAIAYDPTALTEEALRAYETRLGIWFPVAVMSPDDRARLDGLRAAVRAARAAQVSPPAQETPLPPTPPPAPQEPPQRPSARDEHDALTPSIGDADELVELWLPAHTRNGAHVYTTRSATPGATLDASGVRQEDDNDVATDAATQAAYRDVPMAILSSLRAATSRLSHKGGGSATSSATKRTPKATSKVRRLSAHRRRRPQDTVAEKPARVAWIVERLEAGVKVSQRSISEQFGVNNTVARELLTEARGEIEARQAGQEAS